MASSPDLSEDDTDIVDDRAVFYDEVMQLLRQSHTDITFFSHAVSEIDSLRQSSSVQPKDVVQCLMQGVILLPLELHPPKPFNVQLAEVLNKFKVLIGHFNKWRDSQNNYEAGAKEGLETLIKRNVVTSREDAAQLLNVIQRETSIRFNNLTADIERGVYDGMMKELQSVRSMLNLPPNIRVFQSSPLEDITTLSITTTQNLDQDFNKKSDSTASRASSNTASVTQPQLEKSNVAQAAEQHDVDPFSVDWDLVDERNVAVEQQLKKRGLVTSKIVGDGNCFFRAICVVTGRKEDEHLALRKAVAKQMYDEAASSHMILFGETVEAIRKQAEEVAVENTWVGEDVILATTAYLRRPIHVFIAVESCSPLVYGFSMEQGHQPLFVAFQEPGHYNAVVRK